MATESPRIVSGMITTTLNLYFTDLELQESRIASPNPPTKILYEFPNHILDPPFSASNALSDLS